MAAPRRSEPRDDAVPLLPQVDDQALCVDGDHAAPQQISSAGCRNRVGLREQGLKAVLQARPSRDIPRETKGLISAFTGRPGQPLRSDAITN